MAFSSLNIPESTNDYATTFNFTSRTAGHEMYFFCKPWITLSSCCNFAILQVHFQFYIVTTYNLVGLGQLLGQGQDTIMFQRQDFGDQVNNQTSSSVYFFGPAPFSHDIISPVNHLGEKNVINLLSEVCCFIFRRDFFITSHTLQICFRFYSVTSCIFHKPKYS